jgi:resuscitation-promoting factor RpfA
VKGSPAARAVAVLAALTAGYPAAAAALWRTCRSLATSALAGETGAQGIDAAVGAAAAGLALLLASWFAATLAVTVAITARRRPPPQVPGTPAAVRRLAAVLVGAGLAAGPVWVPAASAGQHEPLPSVDRPASTGPLVPDRPAAGPRSPVVVRPGDSLWAIASRRLAGDPRADRPSVGEVAREWPRWYRANRALIGPDPDRLAPGQRLHPPTPKEPR